MKHIHITLSAMFIIILAFSLGIQAQTVMAIGEDEVLIYLKIVDGQKIDYVVIDQDVVSIVTWRGIEEDEEWGE